MKLEMLKNKKVIIGLLAFIVISAIAVFCLCDERDTSVSTESDFDIRITDKLPAGDTSTWIKFLEKLSLADISVQYGGIGSDYLPIVGDWDGDGTDTLGVYQVSTSVFFLSNDLLPGDADIAFDYGIVDDRPIAGDWNGDGTDTIGIYRDGTFHLRNTNDEGEADISFSYGISGDTPITGDWNDDGTDTIGIYRDGTFQLRNTNDEGEADISFSYGISGDTPITGDWNGDGIDTAGIYRDGMFYLLNNNQEAPAGDIIFQYGELAKNDIPIAGDWDGDGTDSIAIYRQDEGVFYLLESLPAPQTTATATPQPTATATPQPTATATVTPQPADDAQDAVGDTSIEPSPADDEPVISAFWIGIIILFMILCVIYALNRKKHVK